jgi:hypothetical protein
MPLSTAQTPLSGWREFLTRACYHLQECGISSDLVEGAEYDQGRIFSAVFEGSERAFCLGARPGDSKDPVTSGVSTFEVYTLGVQVNEEEPVDAPPVISIQGGKMWAACIPPDRVMKKGIRSGKAAHARTRIT